MKKKIVSVLLCMALLLSVLVVPVAATSQDNVAAFVERMYDLVLDRPSEEDGFTFWVDQLKSGQRTGAQLAEFFFLSDEFEEKGLDDDTFVEKLYNTLLDRPSDADGKQEWMRRLAQNCSRTGLLRNFLMSEEFTTVCEQYGIEKGDVPARENRDINLLTTLFVNRLYLVMLDRNSDIDGLNFWTAKMYYENWTAIQVAEFFAFSDEMKQRNPSREEFVTMLYRAFMGREPEGGGFDYWVQRMADGAAKEEIFNGFVTSKEFEEICKDYGVPVGDPIPVPEPGANPTPGTDPADPTDPAEPETPRWYGDGLYLVGRDIPAGEYVAEGTDPAYSAAFMVMRDGSGTEESVLRKGNFLKPMYLTVQNGQYIHIDLGRFIAIAGAPVYGAENGAWNGTMAMYKVGRDIPAGEYQITNSVGDADGYYAILSNSNAAEYNDIDNALFKGTRTVTLAEGQYLHMIYASCKPA